MTAGTDNGKNRQRQRQEQATATARTDNGNGGNKQRQQQKRTTAETNNGRDEQRQRRKQIPSLRCGMTTNVCSCRSYRVALADSLRSGRTKVFFPLFFPGLDEGAVVCCCKRYPTLPR
jgi:hypothetical protein